VRDESSFDAILERLSSLEKEKTIAYQRTKDSETQIAALKNEIDVLKGNAAATELYIEVLAGGDYGIFSIGRASLFLPITTTTGRTTAITTSPRHIDYHNGANNNTHTVTTNDAG
jgi:hypothetical protein